jgi:transposase-like protein
LCLVLCASSRTETSLTGAAQAAKKRPARMMRFSENERKKILQEGHDRGGVKKVCERNGISIRTYYR